MQTFKGIEKTPYTISIKDGFYYIHKVGFNYLPVFGSITKDKGKIRQKMIECLGHTKFRICWNKIF